MGREERPAFGDGEGSRRMEQMNRQGQRQAASSGPQESVSVGAGGSSGTEATWPCRHVATACYYTTTQRNSTPYFKLPTETAS